MKRRSSSIDKVLQRIMTAAGLLLALMILGKAIGMADITPAAGFGADGKSRAARGLMTVWRLSYPAGKTAGETTGKTAGKTTKNIAGNTAGEISGRPKGPSGWIFYFCEWNPVIRYLSTQQEDSGYREEDPAYETYLSSRTFYEEHRYMEIYGDEESGQQGGDTSLAQSQEQSQTLSREQSEAQEQTLASAGGGTAHVLPVTGTQYVMEQLADYDFLMKHFYSVHTSTTATREEMNAKTLLGMDLSIKKDPSQPQILIYHTHSQETYADYGPENPDATVVGIGNYLTELLEAKGYNVIHHTGVYDLVDGKLDRSKAYTYALDGITDILQHNPSVEVVLDLHRDGVKEGLHLVSDINGSQTAPIMFFNGMSQTPEGSIEYLQNPNKEGNLAFSLQMQLDAAAYYPGLTRKIYLKGLRYNLHLRPRSALIEVGAQTNTYEEARNAMEPLAELLDMVLSGNNMELSGNN